MRSKFGKFAHFVNLNRFLLSGTWYLYYWIGWQSQGGINWVNLSTLCIEIDFCFLVRGIYIVRLADKVKGHKFGKIVRWLLFMLCQQPILPLTLWKTLPSFVEGKQRETNTVKRNICNQEQIFFKFLVTELSEKQFASLLVSATVSWD